MSNLMLERQGVLNINYGQKNATCLDFRTKKHLAYKRKKGVLILIIVLLVALIGVEIVMVVAELIGLAG